MAGEKEYTSLPAKANPPDDWQIVGGRYKLWDLLCTNHNTHEVSLSRYNDGQILAVATGDRLFTYQHSQV